MNKIIKKSNKQYTPNRRKKQMWHQHLIPNSICDRNVYKKKPQYSIKHPKISKNTYTKLQKYLQ
jgi:hypothetical protein